MALVKLSPLVDNISGSVGAFTFSRTRGGLAVRARNTRQPDNYEIVEPWVYAMGWASALWASLNKNEIKAWNDAAQLVPYQNRIGDQRKLSGVAYSQSVNIYRRHFLLPLLRVPSLPPVLIQPSDFKIDFMFVNQIQLSFDFQGPVSDYYYILRASPQVSSGLSYRRNLGILDSGSLGSLPSGIELDISAKYVEKYGFLISGRKIFFSLTLFHAPSGWRTHPLRISGVV